jgi:hypothetical protein
VKVAIMQPYFFPYIGYFQMIKAVDLFVVYDNIKYTKKGWINRNRLLAHGRETMFSLPLKKGSDALQVVERELAESFDRKKLLDQFRGAYSAAPYFSQIWPLLERIVLFDNSNLFRYLHHSLVEICTHLGIGSEIAVSSTIPIDHGLKAQDKVIALCRGLHADTYINAIGGRELYSRDEFSSHGIELKFIKAQPIEYAQFGAPFVPWLSIVDVLMFNAPEKVSHMISHNYDLV